MRGTNRALPSRGPDAQAALLAQLPDLIVLDWMLPGDPGISLLARWRQDPRTKALPVIMLTARAQESDKIKGPGRRRRRLPHQALLAGRTDGARAGAAAPPRPRGARRPPAGRQPAPGPGRAPRLQRRRRAASSAPPSSALLRYLMSHPERVHSRAQLLDKVWGDHVFIEERTVDVHIKRLRDALKPVGCADLVETVRGAGYRLTSSGPAVQASA
jgi:two-component system phosphate regulon response regulator PhoB